MYKSPNSFAIASNWLFSSNNSSVSNKLSYQYFIDEQTDLKVRTDSTLRDADAALTFRLSSEVEMRVCCGLALHETDNASKNEKTDYDSPYYGVNI